MKRGKSFFLLLLLMLLAANAPVNAQGFFNRVFVHVFDLNIGGLNSTTDFVLHFPETTGTSGSGSFFFDCFDKDGASSSASGSMAPGETIVRNIRDILSQGGTPGGSPQGDFRGICVVGGPVISTSIWKIQVENTTTVLGTGVSTSNVGQHSYDRSQDSMDWTLAIGEVLEGSNVGVAVHNTGPVATCTIQAVDGTGAAVAGFDAVEAMIPQFGQIATFPFLGQLTGQTISFRVTCDQLVFAIAVIQDAANGFPTPSFGFPLQ